MATNCWEGSRVRYGLLVWLFALSGLTLVAAAENPAPNIILIMADDMGYSDLGSFGGEIDTPNLDKLANQGVRFSQFYNMARCSPTRASLLTGRYPHKVQMGHLAGHRFKDVDGYRGDLDPEVKTLPELLQARDYKNYMVGKWHLASHGPQDLEGRDIGDLANTPRKRGFDQFYGTLLGGNNYFNPKYLFRNDRAEAIEQKDFYYTDAISQEAVQILSQHRSNDGHRPFFLYVAYTAPHWPIQAPLASIAKYRDRYRHGWRVTRKQRYQKMLAQGVIKRGQPMSDWEEQPERWEEAKHPAWEAERMSVHAAMIDHMDQGIGHLLETLQQHGDADNTLVLFLSDNGASAEDFPAEIPAQMLSRLQPVLGKYAPATGEVLAVGNNPAVLPGGKATLQSIGPQWSAVSNTPFRKHKSWVHEGGIATPFIVHWPAGKLAKRGKVNHKPGHVVDILPTLLAAAGLNKESAETQNNSLDGVSLLRSWQGRRQQRGPIYFEHQGNRAMRDGKWKLVAAAGEPWELYNLHKDRAETTNLASAMPRRVRWMQQRYARYAKQSRVQPWDAVVTLGAGG